MGRSSTGIYETTECKKIKLSYLLKNCILVKGRTTSSTLTWSNRGETTGAISIIGVWNNKERYIQLKYITTKRRTNEKIESDYKINIVSVPSNLGKGEVLYFECPSNNDYKCRILYCAYGTIKWYSRKYFESIGYRVYYPSQARSKVDYLYNRKHHYRRLLNEFMNDQTKNFHAFHKGKKTKAMIKYEKLREIADYYDRLCDRITAAVLNKMYSKMSS